MLLDNFCFWLVHPRAFIASGTVVQFLRQSLNVRPCSRASFAVRFACYRYPTIQQFQMLLHGHIVSVYRVAGVLYAVVKVVRFIAFRGFHRLVFEQISKISRFKALKIYERSTIPHNCIKFN